MTHTIEATDFARSYIMWTSTRVHHSPRLPVDAICRVFHDGRQSDYVLSAPCMGETMYAPRDLIQCPPYEFVMIHSLAGAFKSVKFFADSRRDLVECHRVGETMATYDGHGAPIVEMRSVLVRCHDKRELTSDRDIHRAIDTGCRINACTELAGPGGRWRATMCYPIKVCNVSRRSLRWQVDTGPVLIPPPVARSPVLASLTPGYIIFNRRTWAEVAMRHTGTARAASHFGAPRRIRVRTRLFALDRQP